MRALCAPVFSMEMKRRIRKVSREFIVEVSADWDHEREKNHFSGSAPAKHVLSLGWFMETQFSPHPIHTHTHKRTHYSSSSPLYVLSHRSCELKITCCTCKNKCHPPSEREGERVRERETKRNIKRGCSDLCLFLQPQATAVKMFVNSYVSCEI